MNRTTKKATKNAGGALGRAIKHKSKYKQLNPNHPNYKKDLATRHTSGDDDNTDQLKSITHNSDLQELLQNANLADTEFTAERKLSIVSPISFTVNKTLVDRSRLGVDLGNSLPIPKRPQWDSTTTKEQLLLAEKQSFLEWRRQLTAIEEDENLLLTPFEKNLEVWRQLWRVIEKSHVIVQIVDARDPLLFRSTDLDKYVQSLGKKTLLLINKADFLSPKQREIWADYFTKENISFMFWSAAQEKEKFENLNDDVEDFTIEMARAFDLTAYTPTHVYERNDLLAKIFKHCDLAGDNGGRLFVGMVGYPNVGKSSTINILCRQKRVAVSQTPGKTKHFQTILIGDSLCLCDCPGLVFPSYIGTKEEMLCNGLLPIDQMRESLGPITLVCDRIPKDILEITYGIRLPLPKPELAEDPNRNPTAQELLQTFAFARGFMRAGFGTPDESRAARIILKDYVGGKLLYCHHPPTMDREEWIKVGNRMGTVEEIEEEIAKRKQKKSGRTYRDNDEDFLQQEFVHARTKDRRAAKDAKFVRIASPYAAK